MSLWLLWLINVVAVMRVTRFIWRDDLWKGYRMKLKSWLVIKSPPDGVDDPEAWLDQWHEKHKRQFWWRQKIYDLFDCPWCISIWIAAGLMVAQRWLTDIGEDVPVPVWWWLSLSGFTVVFIEWTDGVREVLLKQERVGPQGTVPKRPGTTLRR